MILLEHIPIQYVAWFLCQIFWGGGDFAFDLSDSFALFLGIRACPEDCELSLMSSTAMVVG